MNDDNHDPAPLLTQEEFKKAIKASKGYCTNEAMNAREPGDLALWNVLLDALEALEAKPEHDLSHYNEIKINKDDPEAPKRLSDLRVDFRDLIEDLEDEDDEE